MDYCLANCLDNDDFNVGMNNFFQARENDGKMSANPGRSSVEKADEYQLKEAGKRNI